MTPREQLKKEQQAADKRKLVDAMLLSLRAFKIPPPVTEYRFHPQRKWLMDLAWPKNYLLVELHGGVWSQGRHTRGQGFINDREKMNEAQLMGFRVLEFTVDMIHSSYAARAVARALPGFVLDKRVA